MARCPDSLSNLGRSLLGLQDAARALLQPEGRFFPDAPQRQDSGCSHAAGAMPYHAVSCCVVQCDFIADVLGLSKVGWVFTQAAKDTPDDYIMSSSEVC